jgi:tetratricopeptide (TPR) repeat protein
LDFCKNDGEKMYELLKSLGYEIADNHRLIGYVKFDIMRDAIYDFFDNKRTIANDTLLFYYSGHGVPTTDGNMCISTSEMKSDSPYFRGFSSSDLTRLIKDSVSIRIVIILDCCYSGAASITKGNEDAAATLGTTATQDNARLLQQQGEGKSLLAASQAASEAYALKEQDHSIFTYYLLEGLRGNEDSVDVKGNVTPHSLGNYVYKKITSLPRKKRPNQKPITKTEESGEIILAYYPALTKEPLTPYDVSEIIEDGRQYLENEDYDNAIKSFDKAMSLNPKNPILYNYKGDVFFKLKKYEEAIKCYDAALDLNPKYLDVLKDKGLSLHFLTKYKEAIECFDKVLEIASKNPQKRYGSLDQILHYKGSDLVKLLEYNEAIKSFDKVLEINPNNIDAWYNKGKSLFNLKKYEEAIKCYDAALLISPNEIEILKDKGLALHNRRKYNEAIKCYDAALQINPKNSKVWYYKGLALYNLSKYNEAIKCYDEAIKINPDYSDALKDIKLLKKLQTLASTEISKPVQGPILEYLFVKKWGSSAYTRHDVVLHSPRGIAIDFSGYVFVADSGNHRIVKFDSNGNFITKWGSKGKDDGQFINPQGIAIDSAGDVYVTDDYNHRIVKFDSNGNFITKWGSFGIDDGQFINPQGIAIDSAGDVYVTDDNNHRIQKFDSNGNFITKWGSEGKDDGQFINPQGIAIDSAGYIYITDYSDNINKFKPRRIVEVRKPINIDFRI